MKNAQISPTDAITHPLTMSVSIVMFDYGGVISYLQPEHALGALADAAGTTVPEFRNAYWPQRVAYDAAELDATAYWLGVGARLEHTFSDTVIADLIRLDVASWLHLQPGTIRLIEDLAALGQRLVLLSNAPLEMADAVSALPLARHFNDLLFSCHLRAVKPDEACFAAALDRLDACAGEVAFIDDSEDNVATAGRLGIHSLTFAGPDSARAWLARTLQGAS
jgi:putative hydrolase of the HAD superfamily